MRKIDSFAMYLAEGFGCSRVGDIDPVNIETIDIENMASQPELLSDSILVGRPSCDLSACGEFLQHLRFCMDYSPAGVIVASRQEHLARPGDLREILLRSGMNVAFVGWANEDAPDAGGARLLAILQKNVAPPLHLSPESFRVVALMPTYNEVDIIRHSIEYLAQQGIGVHVVDNWSTDGTFEIAQEFLGRGVIGIERFPSTGPLETYEWRSILGHIESLSEQIEADWFVLHDADERRRSPWAGLNLKGGLYHVDRSGFNCIDHMVLNYWPIDDRFDPNYDVEQQLRFYAFSNHPGHFHQRRAWKNLGCGVSLAPTAGHDIRFPGRLVYPYKFLIKHYPIRSQAHGERKVFRERVVRWSAEERSLGWHQQYDELKTGREFLRNPAELEHIDGIVFEEKFLVERLSGIGVFAEPPFWATPPR